MPEHHWAVGEGFTVMLDGSWRVGQAIEALGFHWYEDPRADDDLYGYVKLKQHLRIPTLATEYSPGGFTASNIHLIMAIRDCEFFKVLLPGGAQKYGLVEDIDVDPEGLVHASTGPGLGARIDFELIERRKLGVLR